MATPDWEKADESLVRELVQEGEKYLQGQLTVATSADQRASVLGGIFAASGTVIIGALMAAELPASVTVAGILSAALFLLASGLCLFTALPAQFALAGNEPESWYEDIEKGRSIKAALGDVAGHIQGGITDNDKLLQRNSRLFFLGSVTGILSPVLGALLWAAITIASCL